MSTRTTPQTENGATKVGVPGKAAAEQRLPRDLCLRIFRVIARARAMEERMIKMSKSGEGYFWIGGPGEEAFNAAVGLQVKKGQGPAYDYLHLHYRNSALMLAMGMPVIGSIRQIAMKATDPHSRGRNFPSHFCIPEWNVVPVSSVIEIQYTMAPGTAHVQKRHGGDGVTLVFGGDAGSAEGDFASCMVWSSRPGNELPVLMVVMNNSYGISTPFETQHGERHVIDRGRAFGIPGEVVDGNDPVASWFAVERALRYCRTERKPYMLEAMVSRLHGHSSSSGALRVHNEPDCQELFAERLVGWKMIDAEGIAEIIADARREADEAADQAVKEPNPEAGDIYLHTYAPSDVDAVYPEDYDGLPG